MTFLWIYIGDIYQQKVTGNINKNNFYQQIISREGMETLIDYRNARYQGETGVKQCRNGYGILVDDDLSFYASHWQDGKINDATVIYISHGKYIYGQWQDNQPHGLNVFRIGDTVVLGEFNNGYLVKKIIVIFEKFNFVAILQDNGGQWSVCQRGLLKSYSELVKYIEDAKIPMKPQYFSLTKFLTSISNPRASASPCQGTENCYYGFQQGLGIVFNSNNGVVSVGSHSNKKLAQFGGKYEHPNFVVEGNFETNQILRYSSQRPKQQIYSIFQRLHKRSLNFKNQYFDSKVKLLCHVEDLIRGKIDEIINQNNHENTFTAHDLNDSLDYHAENLQEINKIREDVYENIHIPMKKTTSQYVQVSPKTTVKRSACVTPVKKTQPILNAPASPIVVKRTPIKMKESQAKYQEKEKEVAKPFPKKNYLNKLQLNEYREETFAQVEEAPKNYQRQLLRTPTKRTIQNRPEPFEYKRQQVNVEEMRQPYNQNQLSRSVTSSSIKRPICQVPNQGKYPNEEIIQSSPIQKILVSSKQYARQKDNYNVPSFKYTCSEVDKNQTASKMTKTITETRIGGSQRFDRPQKVDRIQRTQRIENVEWIDSSSQQSRASVSPLNISRKPVEGRDLSPAETSKSPIKGPNYENLSQRRKRLLKQFKNLNKDAQNSVSPLISRMNAPALSKATSGNINYQKQVPEQPPSTKHSKQKQQNYAELQSPCAREKFPKYQSKNTEQSQGFLPLTICKSGNEPLGAYNWRQDQPVEKDYKPTRLYNQLSQKQNYTQGSITRAPEKASSFKQNLDSSPGLGSRPFEKKDSYYERAPVERQQRPEADLNAHTPQRKVYKYYFNQ